MPTHLLKSTLNVGSMTFLSRILGFVRDVVIARMFGAGMGADAFFVAFRIPNFLRRLFAEGAFSQAFVPVLSEYKTQREHAEVKELVDRVTGSLGITLLAVTAIGVFAAPLLVMVFAPGFIHIEDKFELTAQMLRITFPYLLFIALTALAGSILNAYGRFGIPAFTPIFLNLAMIGCALWLAPLMAEPVMALAWGVFIAGIVQLLFQLPFLYRLRLLPRPRRGKGNEGVRRITRLMLPAIFGSSVAQINLLFDTLIASFLVTGSVSWLYYSDRLVEFPLGIFGIALATVVLPSLSRNHADASAEEFSGTLDWALRWVMLVGIPATTGLLVLAGPMLTTLFHYGEFTAHDVAMATRSLMAYSLGLLGFILVKVLATGFYARQNTKTPVRIGVISMAANMVMNVVFVFPLAHAGLALATSLAAFLNAAMLYYHLRKDQSYTPQAGWGVFLLRVLAATAVMTGVLYWGSGHLDQWLAWSWHERAMSLSVWIVAGACAFFASLWLSGMRWRHLHMAIPGKP